MNADPLGGFEVHFRRFGGQNEPLSTRFGMLKLLVTALNA